MFRQTSTRTTSYVSLRLRSNIERRGLSGLPYHWPSVSTGVPRD